MKMFLYLFVYALLLTSKTLAAEDIKIMTLNIRYYGLGGSMNGTPAKEKRDQYLKDYFKSEIPNTDIMIFQEIVDVDRLIKKVINRDMSCLSYESQNEKHQHVVICLNNKYRFQQEPTDNNNLIDDVSIDGIQKSRPAVHTLVKNTQGKTILRLVGVHLKAYPDQFATRASQVEVIAEYLKPLMKTNIPTVIAGDFNSYPIKDSGNSLDDNQVFTNIFQKNGLNLTEASNDFDFTFRSSYSRGHFDRLWYSSYLKVIERPQVHGPCNDSEVGRGPFTPEEFYQKISDHCPVSLTLQLE